MIWAVVRRTLFKKYPQAHFLHDCPTKLSTEKGLPATCLQRAHAFVIHIAVQNPLHSNVGGLLSYTHGQALPPAPWCACPGQRASCWGGVDLGAAAHADLPAGVVLRPLAPSARCPGPLAAPWRQLVAFTARYYQRSLGEIAATALPPALRKLSNAIAAALANKKQATQTVAGTRKIGKHLPQGSKALSVKIEQNSGPVLLYGAFRQQPGQVC